jgi:hypothetical protein
MKKYLAVPVALAATALSLAACGGTKLEAGVPNVRGLSLPDAQSKLASAGYQADYTTDAMFGVLVPSHFTVCKESNPNGKLVPIVVNKTCS